MVYFLKKGCFEPMHMQMKHEEHGTISFKNISELTDMPMYKSTTNMSKHIHDFESYLSSHYGVEGDVGQGYNGPKNRQSGPGHRTLDPQKDRAAWAGIQTLDP